MTSLLSEGVFTQTSLPESSVNSRVSLKALTRFDRGSKNVRRPREYIEIFAKESNNYISIRFFLLIFWTRLLSYCHQLFSDLQIARFDNVPLLIRNTLFFKYIYTIYKYERLLLESI